MSESADILGQRSLMIIFAYASAGLGHLRVTEALYHGLPSQANPVLLAAPDKSITYLHRFSSIHPLARSLMEWLQSGEPEELFTRAVRSFLRNNTRALYQRIQTLLDQRFTAPDTILFVATHFGLAHQFAAIKDELIRTRGVKVLLVVQVTDDSPQRIWYVPGADLIVVPSEHTATELTQYGQATGLPPVRFASLPYPVSPMLAQTLSSEELAQRRQQMNPGGEAEIQVAIPISGAAVGLTYFRAVIDELYRQSTRFRFHFISRVNLYTQAFLSEIASHPYVVVDQAATDLAVVEKYERVYQETLIALEITKPSEQAFKALFSPEQRGGALLLFSEPVGRQERDNLAFLDRHQLLPTPADQQQMWDLAAHGTPLGPHEAHLLQAAQSWRGIRLPADPVAAARYIAWNLQQGVFVQMLDCTPVPRPLDRYPQELGWDGVHQFWQAVSGLVSANQDSR